MSSIKINHLSFGFTPNNLLFKDLSLSIPTSSFSLLTGPSGSGKSTFLKLLAQLYPTYGGKIVQGSIQNLPTKWSMIFQNPDEQFTMATPAQEFIFTLENLNLNSQQAKKRMMAAVQQTNIKQLLHRNFSTLSGGEKQRVAFAIILAMRPNLLLLDEPFASCDPSNRAFLIKQLALLKQKDITIIISDHDFSYYQHLIDQVFWCSNHTIKHSSLNQLSTPKDTRLNFISLPHPTPILKLENFSLHAQEQTLIQEQNLALFTGATLLTGPNGSGKSSFFRALTKMQPYNGQVLLHNKNIQKIKNKKYFKQIGQVFQDPNNQFLMVTVAEELKFGLLHCNNPLLKKATVNELLTLINLNQHQDQVVYSLSGGQKKKLQVLLMLLANPTYLLLDEPFAGLDQYSQQQLITLLQQYFLKLDSQKGLILISHQFNNLDNFFNYHLVLQDKELQYVKEKR